MKIANLVIPATIIMLTLAGCEKNGQGSEGGEYNATFELSSASGIKVSELQPGVNRIDMTLSNSTYTLVLAFGTREDELPAAHFDYSTSLAEGRFTAELTALNSKLALGSDTAIEIKMPEIGSYDITLTSTVGKDRIKGHFAGAIKFKKEIEVGDPSGNMILVSEGEASDENGNVKAGVTKYTIHVYSPEGEDICSFDAVNKSGLTLAELAGTYSMTSYPTKEWTMDNGWVMYYPGIYEAAGGSFYVDGSGTSRYITKGEVTIALAKDRQGNTLFSFSGEDLETLTAKNEPAKGGSFNVKFAAEIEQGCSVESDMTIKSDILNRDMLYSVILPKSWDGKKKFPVLYLLHGYEGTGTGNNKWITDGSFASQLSLAIALGKAKEMVVILPNCALDGTNWFYRNDFVPGDRYMDYFFKEFVP